MRSQGTKATQGINGDAAALERRDAAALRMSRSASARTYDPCHYERHRPAHAARPDGPLVCLVCHPLTTKAGIVTRSEPGFDELAEAARSRMTGYRIACPCGAKLVNDRGQVLVCKCGISYGDEQEDRRRAEEQELELVEDAPVDLEALAARFPLAARVLRQSSSAPDVERELISPLEAELEAELDAALEADR